jgi:hypothetical protein
MTPNYKHRRDRYTNGACNNNNRIADMAIGVPFLYHNSLINFSKVFAIVTAFSAFVVSWSVISRNKTN